MIALFRVVFRVRRIQAITFVVFFAYLALYLFSTRYLTFSLREWLAGRLIPSFVADGWQDILFRARAPFLFEPIGIVNLGPLRLFLSIPNLLIGLALAALVALNVAVSYYQFRSLGLRGTKGFASLAGTIPAVLSGTACCVPTLILVLGLQFTATLAALWSWFVPVSFMLLIASIFWSLQRISRRVR